MIKTNSTITFTRKGALKAFFISDGGIGNQLTFMQAIGYIKAEPDDKKLVVPGDYYKQFNENDTAFDQMLTAEEEVSTEVVMVAGNDAKIIRLLKAIKADPRLTDDQEEKINKMISLWENGEISGFDYRYFKESVGLRITKEFISRAKSIGRYDKQH